jgi:hypothetical protein
MLSPEEQKIVLQVKQQGWNSDDAADIIKQYRSHVSSQSQPSTQAPTPAPSKPIFQDQHKDEGIVSQTLNMPGRAFGDAVNFVVGGVEQWIRGANNVMARGATGLSNMAHKALDENYVEQSPDKYLLKENKVANYLAWVNKWIEEQTKWNFANIKPAMQDTTNSLNKMNVEKYGNQGIGGDIGDVLTGWSKAALWVMAPWATLWFGAAAQAPWLQYWPQALSAWLMWAVNAWANATGVDMSENTKENVALGLWVWMWKLIWKTSFGKKTGLENYYNAKAIAMAPIVKPIENMGKAVVEKGGEIVWKTKEAITPNWANISTRANRFNALDEQKFIDATWETPGQFATSRWMTKVWPKAVDEAVQKFEKSKAEADKAFEQVEWKFRYNGQGEDLVHTMVSDLDKRLTNVKSPEAPKIAQLKTKYENEWLTMSEINDLKRTYARNFKYAFQEMGSEPAMRSTNLQNALREWQFWVAKDNWLSNIAEINKNTQGWKMFADSLAKKLDRSWANNQFWLTDWIALAWWTPANIALFLGKQWLSSNFVKEWVIKAFTKQDKPDIIPASYEWIVKSNIEKQYANPSSVLRSRGNPGGESMVRPAWLLPAPSEKTIVRNQNVEVSKKILKESKAKEAVTKQPEVTTRSKIVIPKE